MQLHIKLNRWALLVSVLCIGVANLFAASPVVQSVTYHDNTNVLEFVFDQEVFNDLSMINRSFITLDGDNGGSNPDLTLSGGTLTGNTEFAASIGIKLSLADQKIIEDMVDRESLQLVAKARAFLNSSHEGTAAITLEDAFAVTYEVDPNPPIATAAVYNAGTNILEVTFSEEIDYKSIDLIKMLVDDDAGGGNADLQFKGGSAGNSVVQTTRNSNVFTFGFTPKHQQKLEAMDLDNLLLIMQPYAALDLDRNTNVTLGAEETTLSITVIPEPEEEKTQIDSANYDAARNRLTIYMNEAPVTSYKWYDETIEAVTYTGFTIHELGSAIPVSSTISGKENVKADGNTLWIEVLSADQRLIESLDNKDEIYLTVDAFSILDKNLNGIQPFPFENKIKVSYTPIEELQTPALDSVKYDATNNILTLSFVNIDARTKGIDTSNVNLAGIKLITADSVLTLNGGTVSGIKTGKPAFIRNVDIAVTKTDEAIIETNALKGLSVKIDGLAFFFSGSKNGNFPSESVPVEYFADEGVPSIVRFKYNFMSNEIQIDLDKLIKIDKFQPSALTIGGVRLSGGTIEEESFAEQLTFSLNETDSIAINGLDVSVKKDLTVDVDAGVLVNLDDFSNTALSFKNADTTAQGDTIVVGYGRGFWDKSFEAFPTLDQLVSSSLRGVGDHCYIYVADDQWISVVNDSMVQAFIDLFEKNCPADPSKGVYQVIREAFGEEKDTDGDPKITLLLTDLRDQYGVGGNNRSATWPKAGYYTYENELPVSEYGHSNELDMLYIDSYPIVEAGLVGNVMADQLTRMIMYHTDPDEEEWVVDGIASMAQMLAGFDFQSFEVDGNQKPAMAIKGSPENVLPLWTGWQAGMVTDWLDLYNTFLFHLYLYEQYGGFDIIKTIAKDVRYQGLESINAALNNISTGLTASDIFPDYALASYLDKWVNAEYEGKYAYKSLNLGYSDVRLIDWKNDSHWRDSFNWTYKFFKIKKDEIPAQLRFNGTDGTNFQVSVATTGGTPTVQIAEIDPVTNIATMDMSSFIQLGEDLVVAVSNVSSGSILKSNFVLSSDTKASDYVKMNIFQNPSADRVMDVYIVSDEKLYLDVAGDDPTSSTTGEGAPIYFSTNGDTTMKTAVRSLTNENESFFLYHAEVTLETSGTYQVIAKGQDIAGNKIATTNTNVELGVRKVLANQDAILETPDNSASLTITAGSLPNDLTLISFTDKTESDETVYRFGNENKKLNKNATLTIRYADDVDGSGIAVYQKINNTWKAVGGVVNLTKKNITVQIDQLGDFKIAKGNPESVLDGQLVPDSYEVFQNYPNPFNPTTTIRYGIPEAGMVKLTIFNVLGEEVATILEEHQKAGYHRIAWDAAGLGSGIYFYKLQCNDFTRIRKMTLIK